MSRGGYEPGIYDSLILEFAVAHKPTQPPRPENMKQPMMTGNFHDTIYQKIVISMPPSQGQLRNHKTG